MHAVPACPGGMPGSSFGFTCLFQLEPVLPRLYLKPAGPAATGATEAGQPRCLSTHEPKLVPEPGAFLVCRVLIGSGQRGHVLKLCV